VAVDPRARGCDDALTRHGLANGAAHSPLSRDAAAQTRRQSSKPSWNSGPSISVIASSTASTGSIDVVDESPTCSASSIVVPALQNSGRTWI
jgi:hypothetical protein